jgi:hypothetical protein
MPLAPRCVRTASLSPRKGHGSAKALRGRAGPRGAGGVAAARPPPRRLCRRLAPLPLLGLRPVPRSLTPPPPSPGAAAAASARGARRAAARQAARQSQAGCRGGGQWVAAAWASEGLAWASARAGCALHGAEPDQRPRHPPMRSFVTVRCWTSSALRRRVTSGRRRRTPRRPGRRKKKRRAR